MPLFYSHGNDLNTLMEMLHELLALRAVPLEVAVGLAKDEGAGSLTPLIEAVAPHRLHY